MNIIRNTLIKIHWPFRLLIFLCLVIVSVKFLPDFLRKTIKIESINESLHPFLNLFFPPDDINNPLALINLTSDTEKLFFKFTHQYCGNYILDIEVNNLKIKNIFPVKQMPECFFKLKFKILLNDKILLNEELNPLSPFWTNSTSGINYYRYKVPDNLPYLKELTGEIEVDKNRIKDFLDKFGNAKLILRKGSDE